MDDRKYRWVIVATLLIGCIIWAGLGFFVFSIFVKPLQAEFGWDRSTIMASFMISSIVVGISSVFVGNAVDKFGPRNVIVAGSAITGLGFACLGMIQTLFHLYLGYIVVGIGISAIGQVSSTALITEWFDKKRGLALGVMSMGIGLGGLIIPPLTGGWLIPSLGWRLAYLSLGILASAIMVPLSLFVIKSKGMVAGDENEIRKDSEQIAVEPYGSVNEINDFPKYGLRSPLLWVISFSFLLSQFGGTGTIQSQVPHLDDMGFPGNTAAYVLGMVGLVSSFSKFFFGWICDFMRAKHAFMLGVMFQSAGTLILLNLKPSSPAALLWLYVFSMGMGAGYWLPVMSLSVSRNFSLRTYGTLFGVVNFALSLGVATGPLLAGYVYDITGGYIRAFQIFMAFYALSIIVALLGRAHPDAYNSIRKRMYRTKSERD